MIFVHASFRCSRTYIWAHLRQAPRTVAYYEVFHEILASLTPGQIDYLHPAAWRSNHPPTKAYFTEYQPLIRFDGGIFGFDPAMSYERFIPAGGCRGPITPAEAQYLAGLVAHAEHRGQIPVLTASRSLGRIWGIKAALPGLHVGVYRNLFHQWCSFYEQAYYGNPYFIERISAILQHSQHDPVLAELSQAFPLDAASHDDANLFYSFLFLHLHCYVQGAGALDLIIDVNRLSTDRQHRETVEAAFRGQDIAIDLSDARRTTTFSLTCLGSVADFKVRLAEIDALVLAHAPDPAGSKFGHYVLADLLEEYERDSFYTGGLRLVLSGPDGVISERDRLRARHAEAVAANDRLAAELAALSLLRDTASAESQVETAQALAQAANLSAALEAQTVANHHLRLAIAGHEATTHCLTQQIAAAKAQIAAEQAATAQAETAWHEAAAQLQQALTRQEESDAIQQALQTANEHLTNSLAAAENDLSRTQDQATLALTAAQQRADQFVVALNGQSAVNRDLHNTIAEQEEAQHRLTQQLHAAAAQIAAGQDEAAHAAAARAQLASSLAAAQHTNAELTSALGLAARALAFQRHFATSPAAPLFRWMRRLVLLGSRHAARRRRWATAEHRYRRLLGADPHDARLWMQYGHCLKEQGQPLLAEGAYREALRIAGDCADPLFHLAHALQRQGLQTEARQACVAACRLDPALAPACQTMLTAV